MIQKTNFKNTYLSIILLASISMIFLPFSTLQAATLSNGMNASNVLGEEDFTSVNLDGDIDDLSVPLSMTVDAANQRLFAMDFDGTSSRVLIYDISAGFTDGMDASFVLGQGDFDSNATGTTAALFAPQAYDVEFDSNNEYLFVSDTNNHRVLVYDLSGTITNGMSAFRVLGQANFTDSPETTTAASTPYATGLAYDTENDLLFVGSLSQQRVSVFNLASGITNNMAATYFLGQENGTSGGVNLDRDGLSAVQFMDYDQANDRLFIAVDTQARVLVYDLSSGVTTGMDAAYVLGQANFTSKATALTAAGMAAPHGVAYDSELERLFVSDVGYGRVTVFDLSGTVSTGMNANFVLGNSNFTSVSTGTTAGLFGSPFGIFYDTGNDSLYVAETDNSRVTIFNLTPTLSSGGNGYIHPPLCSANISPRTITKGERATLSWNTTWPTERRGTFFTKVPGEGLYSSKVKSITIQPDYTTKYVLASFNLWGANFCEAEVAVINGEGTELTSERNSLLTAGAANSTFARSILSFFSRLFVR